MIDKFYFQSKCDFLHHSHENESVGLPASIYFVFSANPDHNPRVSLKKATAILGQMRFDLMLGVRLFQSVTLMLY